MLVVPIVPWWGFLHMLSLLEMLSVTITCFCLL
jgi:hypothetical protein